MIRPSFRARRPAAGCHGGYWRKGLSISRAPPSGRRTARRRACSSAARVVPVTVAAVTAGCSSTVAGVGDKGDLSPPLPSRPGRRDGRPRGDGCQWGGDGGGGGGRFGGSGGLVSGSRLPGLPALRAPGAGAQPELAADGLLRHEGLRLQGPPGDAAQTPGGTDGARRAAPAGPGPGRRP